MNPTFSENSLERELINKLISINELEYSSSNPSWEKRRRLRWLLYEAGKIICEWDGMQAREERDDE